MGEETPIAWLALPTGTPVYSSDGAELGKVTEVVGDEQKDIFSGISLSSGILDSVSFVAADLVDQITTGSVRVTFPAAEAPRRLTAPP